MKAAVQQSLFAWLVFRLSHFACGARLGRRAKSEVNASEGVMGCSGLFDLLIIGDFGGRNSLQADVAAGLAVMAGNHNPAAIIGTGDNIYPDGAEGSNELMKQWWRDIYLGYGSLQRNWHSVCGNHDWYTDGRQQYNFTSSSGNTGGHWKMDYLYYYKGWRSTTTGVTVAMYFIDTMVWMKDSKVAKYIDVNREYENQKNWLINGLSSSRADWLIVVGHHPIWSAGYHGSTDVLVRELDPIMRTYGANIYISGHDHSQQLIRYRGINYIVSGAGSQSARSPSEDYPDGAIKAFYTTKGGFARLRFCSAAKAELKFHKPDGVFQTNRDIDNLWPGAPPAPPPPGSCTDDPPDNYYTCEEQAAFGKCNEDWMQGYCCCTCGCSKVASQEENPLRMFNMSTGLSECEGVVLKEVDKRCSTDGCTVLADRPLSQTCERYCSDHGLSCVGAWTQDDENCKPSAPLGCEVVARETMNNLMCRCGKRG